MANDQNNAGSKHPGHVQQQQMGGDVTQDAAAGEPSLSGRSHGHLINDDGTAAGRPLSMKGGSGSSTGHNDNTSGKSGKVTQATESGRQRAVE